MCEFEIRSTEVHRICVNETPALSIQALYAKFDFNICSSLLFCRNLHFWDGAEIRLNSFKIVEQISHIFEVHFQLNDVILKTNNATYGMFFESCNVISEKNRARRCS